MRVRQGWSGEVKPNQWVKFDVELDEEDLRRLLAADDRWTEDTKISLGLAYMLLENEAERLVTTKLVSRWNFDFKAGQIKTKQLAERRAELLDRVYAGESS